MKFKIYWKEIIFLFLSFLFSVTLSILVAILEPQNNFAQTFVYSLVLSFNILVVFLMSLPYLNRIIIDYLRKKKYYYYSFLTLVLLFPLLNWVFLHSLVEFVVSFISYLSWIILPVIAFIQAYEIKKFKHKAFLYIAGVLILAYGFDTRIMYSILSGFEDGKYNFSAIWISAIILTIYSIQVEKVSKKLTWELNLKKTLLSIGSLLVISFIVIPLGLYTNFLIWSPDWPGLVVFVVSFIGIWFTIALPEELIARSIIQYQLSERTLSQERKFYPYYKWIALLISSFIFGLSHYNNTSLEFAWIYIGFATFAGIIYGLCWRYANLATAMLTHTLVDWIWQLLFK